MQITGRYHLGLIKYISSKQTRQPIDVHSLLDMICNEKMKSCGIKMHCRVLSSLLYQSLPLQLFILHITCIFSITDEFLVCTYLISRFFLLGERVEAFVTCCTEAVRCAASVSHGDSCAWLLCKLSPLPNSGS